MGDITLYIQNVFCESVMNCAHCTILKKHELKIEEIYDVRMHRQIRGKVVGHQVKYTIFGLFIPLQVPQKFPLSYRASMRGHQR
jgi:hypothetical protein